MKKTLKRRPTRWSIAMMWIGAFCTVLWAFSYGTSLPFLCAMLFFLIVFVILTFCANRCPYCGTFFRGGEWSKPHAGYCNKCGKLMEYDDAVAEREREKALNQE